MAGEDRPLVVLLLNPATTTAGPGKSYGCEAVRGEGGGGDILVKKWKGSERKSARGVTWVHTRLSNTTERWLLDAHTFNSTNKAYREAIIEAKEVNVAGAQMCLRIPAFVVTLLL